MLETFRSHYPKIYSLVFSRTAVNTGLVFSGNILAAIVTFFTIAVISRTLGPASFGIFSLATALATLIAGFTDFGLGSSLVRFFNLNLEREMSIAVFLLGTTPGALKSGRLKFGHYPSCHR